MFGRKRTTTAAKPEVVAKSEISSADKAGNAVTDAEIAAVIAAAVAAYQSGEAEMSRDIVYRKINRTAGPRTEWNLAGLREILENRSL